MPPRSSLAGIPLAVALGLAAAFTLWLYDLPIAIVAQAMYTSVNSFLLIAVPLAAAGLVPGHDPRRIPWLFRKPCWDHALKAAGLLTLNGANGTSPPNPYLDSNGG
jgi:hypothetical protein